MTNEPWNHRNLINFKIARPWSVYRYNTAVGNNASDDSSAWLMTGGDNGDSWRGYNFYNNKYEDVDDNIWRNQVFLYDLENGSPSLYTCIATKWVYCNIFIF